MSLEKKLEQVIRKDKYGKLYVLKSQLIDLRLSEKEQIKVEKILKDFNISIKEHAQLVKDFEYGVQETYEINNLDKPVHADLVYNDNGDLIFEDYQKLDKYLEKFIESHVVMKKGVDPVTNEIVYFPSIPLNCIVKLGLSEVEQNHVMDFLIEREIRVGGNNESLNSNFENYDYYRNYKSIILPAPLSEVEEKEKFALLKLTKDPVIRQQLILHNMRLVPYIVWKYARFYGINRHELESYGYEGLIEAVDKFDVTKGFKFSSFATNYIKNYIKVGYYNILSDGKSSFSVSYLKAKRIVETKYNTTLYESPDLIEEILDLLVDNKNISDKNREYIKRRINLFHAISLEQMDDIPQMDGELEDVDDKLVLESLKKILSDLFGTLTAREEMIISYLYGLNGKKYSCNEIAKQFNLSSSRIKQIEDIVLKKLRKPSNIRKLRENYGDDIFKKK